jgi:hypothetical protein
VKAKYTMNRNDSACYSFTNVSTLEGEKLEPERNVTKLSEPSEKRQVCCEPSENSQTKNLRKNNDTFNEKQH